MLSSFSPNHYDRHNAVLGTPVMPGMARAILHYAIARFNVYLRAVVKLHPDFTRENDDVIYSVGGVHSELFTVSLAPFFYYIHAIFSGFLEEIFIWRTQPHTEKCFFGFWKPKSDLFLIEGSEGVKAAFDSFPLIIIASSVGVGSFYSNDKKHDLPHFSKI